MRNLLLFGSLLAAVSTAIACGDASVGNLLGGQGYGPSGAMGPGPSANDDGGSSATADGGGNTSSDAATTPPPPTPDGGGAGTGGNTGLPCAVQKVIEDSCIACHSQGGQSPPLTDYAHLVATSPQYPGQTVAQRCLARLQAVAPTTPMPPPPANPPTAAEIQAFSDWVNAGTPMAPACTTLPDAGTPPPPPQTCPNGVDAPSSGGGGYMHPGQACDACHQQSGGGDAPRFAVGGTVFWCAGAAVPSGVVVEITDANGKVVDLPILSNGNFCTDSRCNGTSTPIVPPFHAKVKNGASERAMSGSITAGDCNSCHTATGANGAPGRVLAP